jgi:hypothetical protein
MSNIIDIWTEITRSGDGVAITLYSESAEGEAMVEDMAWCDASDSQKSPLPLESLNLSDETQAALQSENEEPETGLEAGELVIDEGAPNFGNPEIRITEIMDVPAEEYVIDGPQEGKVVPTSEQRFSDKTVADANAAYPEDDPVILGRYADESAEYAFPASRLEKIAP